MLILIGSFLSILIPFLIYNRILKGKEHMGKAAYIKTFLLSATLYTIPIIILEILWDIFFKDCISNHVLYSFICSFFRAALLEEGVKYFFAYRLLKKHQNLDMREAILLAGVVGIGYGFLEKLFYGGGAMIVNALLPGHMLFQWIMGYFLYKAIKTEGKEHQKFMLLAFIIPFTIHGFWDFGIIGTDGISELGTAYMLTEFIVVLVMVIIMLTAIIKGSIRISKINSEK